MDADWTRIAYRLSVADAIWLQEQREMKMKLAMQLVPETSWRENLRNKMGRTRWDKLRKQILVEQGSVCRICGSTNKLQCHEVWEFDDAIGEPMYPSATKGFVNIYLHFQLINSICRLTTGINRLMNGINQIILVALFWVRPWQTVQSGCRRPLAIYRMVSMDIEENGSIEFNNGPN